MLTILAVIALAAPTILTDVPARPDPQGRYTFYLHGRLIEMQGRNAVSKDFGRYQYDEILGALAATGRTVIAEVRTTDAGQEFVDKVAAQVKALRAAGVPGEHI